MRSIFGLLAGGFALCSLRLCATTDALAAEAADGALARAKSHFAKLDTNQVHYLALGQGASTLVFVHCWAGNLAFWRFQLPALQERARLILIDLPGHGKSDAPQTGYTMERYACAVEAVLRDAKVDQAVLVGHSMGVNVISRFYRDFPSQTQALVAVDGSLRGFDLSREQFDQWVGPYRGPEYRATVAKFIDDMFPVAGTEALREQAKAAMLRTPQRVMVSSLEGIFDRAAWECHRIEAPVLVINAPNPIWTADYEAYVRKLAPQLVYRMVPGTGHFLMQEKPDAFNNALLEFLRQRRFVTK
jgi:pimeloyl-ACP methyl ester carboxylesterase